jgi:hypothetical protein
MKYETTGQTSLADIFGDFVVYRNLIPADPRVPPADALRTQLGLEAGVLPRKAEPLYGTILAEMLRHARRVESPQGRIEQLVYIGDTLMNDGTAFRNLCAAGGWPGWAFIGADDPSSPPQTEVEAPFYVSNRWSALPDFLRFLESVGFALDETTAVVIDVDKTAIGARGRNDKVIDLARVEGVMRTVADLLGPRFDEAAFRVAYDELNQPAYHVFTADNQDYLAYICLILGAGLWELGELIEEVRDRSVASFQNFIARVQTRRSELAPTGLTSIHDDVWERVEARDPTPFKAFRYNEYLTTAARFRDLPGASPEEGLSQRIVITQEVRDLARVLKEGRGCLLFGVSDKPDEASMPSPEQAREGKKPLHRLTTLVVGEV